MTDKFVEVWCPVCDNRCEGLSMILGRVHDYDWTMIESAQGDIIGYLDEFVISPTVLEWFNGAYDLSHSDIVGMTFRITDLTYIKSDNYFTMRFTPIILDVHRPQKDVVVDDITFNFIGALDEL